MKLKQLTLLAIAGLLAVSADAQTFLTKRDNTVATNANVIFPGRTGKQIVLLYADVTGQGAGSKLHLLSGGSSTVLTAAAGTTVTNVSVNGTGSFVAGDIAVIQRSSGVCTWHWVYSAGTNKVYFEDAIGTAASTSDQLWRMSHTGTNTVAAATVKFAGDLWAAQVRAPLLVRVTGGTTELINSATIKYENWNQ